MTLDIEYREGDATDPPMRPVVIAHIVNDAGVMGAGFALAIADRYPHVKNQYRAWRLGRTPLGKRFELGMTQVVKVGSDLFVANMLAQRGLYQRDTNPNPLQLFALDACLGDLGTRVKPGTTVVMPRIGTGLAHGRWSHIEPMVMRNLIARDIPVIVYDLS